jgi:hypothetical protein
MAGRRKETSGFIVNLATPAGFAKAGKRITAAPALDPTHVERLRSSLADERRTIPAADVRQSLSALHEARLKRGA